MTGKELYVTVGTTKFDLLIKTVMDEKCLSVLKQLGYEKILLQIGNGTYEPKKTNALDMEWYRLKESIQSDIKKADLVISHAGAGSCLEVLENGKPLLVVINEELMDNHQFEIAEKFAEENYLYYCTCSTLLEHIKKDFSKLAKYPLGNPKLFSDYLSKAVGFS